MSESQVLVHQGAIKAYDPFRGQLAELKDLNARTVFDYEDPKGNKEARSHIFKLRQTKAAVEKARKQEKAASLEYGRKVDSEAKEIIGEIDGMIEIHAHPIAEIEAREERRVTAIRERIEDMRSLAADDMELRACGWQDRLNSLEAIPIDDSWNEFTAEAAKVKDEILSTLRRRLAERQKYEAEQAELARLRQESEERERRDREDALRREGEERARKEAEQAAQRERDREERERREAEEAAQRRELEAQRAIEQAKREKAEAEARAERAAKEERERIEREQREAKMREEQEAAKREGDRKHKAAVNNAAVAAMVEFGIPKEHAKAAVMLIAKKEIPNVSIAY